MGRERIARACIATLAAVALLALLPESAWACPVCFDSSDENRQAFLVTTALLSLLPLGMVAGAGLWLRRRSKDRDDGHADPDPNRSET